MAPTNQCHTFQKPTCALHQPQDGWMDGSKRHQRDPSKPSHKKYFCGKSNLKKKKKSSRSSVLGQLPQKGMRASGKSNRSQQSAMVATKTHSCQLPTLVLYHPRGRMEGRGIRHWGPSKQNCRNTTPANQPPNFLLEIDPPDGRSPVPCQFPQKRVSRRSNDGQKPAMATCALHHPRGGWMVVKHAIRTHLKLEKIFLGKTTLLVAGHPFLDNIPRRG